VLFTVSPVWAQDVTETWTNKIVESLDFNDGKTYLIYLSGDITIKGTITLDNATTVRFLNNSGNEVTIHNGNEGTRTFEQPMFKVINGAKLAFNYATEVSEEYSTIVIDGGANFNDMVINEAPAAEWTLTPENPECLFFETSIIQSIGSLELYDVTIRNYHMPNNKGVSVDGAISLARRDLFEKGANKEYGYTKLVNCTIEKCLSKAGTAINVDNSNYLNTIGLDPNDEEHLITLQGCTIRHCATYGDDDGWGGMIRFKGGSVHSLYLKDCVFEENFSYGDGAGLWWNAAALEATECTINGCTFRNNRAMRECGAIRIETNVAFVDRETIVSGNKCFGKDKFTDENLGTYVDSDIANGGGISIYGYASSAYELGGPEVPFTYNLSKFLKVSGNYAKGCGGGIAFDFTKKTALLAETQIIALFNGATIENNVSGENGGGVSFRNETIAEKNYKFNIYLNSGTIAGNKAPEGGGLYVSKLDIVDSSVGAVDRINITGNEATNGSGGGIYLVDGSVSLNETNITVNSTTNGSGGGVYLENGSVSLNGANITDNSTTNGSGGGICLVDGSVSLYEANIQNNMANVTDDTSFAGGGGVYVENGNFTISSGSKGEISGNTSTSFGGGVLVKSGTVGEDNLQAVTLSGGTIKDNEAHYGGGLAALGNLSLTLNQVNIENNTALNGNGGGVFVRGGITAGLTDYATLTYNAGIVRQNEATCTGDKPETAFGNKTGTGSTDGNVTYASVAGMGGGICLGMNTTLQFAKNLANFGIYDNEADSGADDLFATENNTVVNLPDVEEMHLQGYPEKERHTLFWFEDYITNDPNYNQGTNLKGEAWNSDKTNQRYRDVRNGIVDGDVYYYTFPENETSARFEKKYLCLTLGWNVGLIYLIKEGMADGENAIFRILKKQGENDYKEYMTVILTDADKNNDGKRVKQITLNEDGTWKIEETPWSWAYTSTPPTDPERTLNASSTVADRTFTFTNTLKTGDDVPPPHGESVKVNNMNTVQQQ